MAGTPSSRRTTATAGCAVSRHILGQAEPETAEQMAGSHGRSKIGRNGEYPVRIESIVLQSIHLDGAVLVPLRALYCFLLFLTLPPITVYHSTA